MLKTRKLENLCLLAIIYKFLRFLVFLTKSCLSHVCYNLKYGLGRNHAKCEYFAYYQARIQDFQKGGARIMAVWRIFPQDVKDYLL